MRGRVLQTHRLECTVDMGETAEGAIKDSIHFDQPDLFI